MGFSLSLFAIAIDRKRCLPGPRSATGKGWNHGVWEVLCCWVEDWETLVLRCFLPLGRGADTKTVDTICAGRGHTCSWQGLVWLAQILVLADWPLVLLMDEGRGGHGLNYLGSVVATISVRSGYCCHKDVSSFRAFPSWNIGQRFCVFLESVFFYLASINYREKLMAKLFTSSVRFRAHALNHLQIKCWHCPKSTSPKSPQGQPLSQSLLQLFRLASPKLFTLSCLVSLGNPSKGSSLDFPFVPFAIWPTLVLPHRPSVTWHASFSQKLYITKSSFSGIYLSMSSLSHLLELKFCAYTWSGANFSPFSSFILLSCSPPPCLPSFLPFFFLPVDGSRLPFSLVPSPEYFGDKKKT